MATKTVKARLLLKTQTAAEWAAENPVLLKGEAGIESDTRHWKTGDGTTAWNDLPYRSEGLEVGIAAPSAVDGIPGTFYYDQSAGRLYILLKKTAGNAWEQVALASDLADLGAGDMLASIYAKAAGAGPSTGKVDHALQADKLAAARTISATGDVSGDFSFNGSADVETTLTLASILAAQSDVQLPKISVDAKGRITSISAMAPADVRTLLELGTAAQKNAGNAAGNVPLIGSDGKLDTAIMPQLAITDVFDAASKSAMLALKAQQGDVCRRTDEGKTYILAGTDPKVEANWKLFLMPECDVVSVNGKTGIVVLSTDDIAEGGTNLYWTQERFNTAFGTAFAAKSTTDLKEGDNLYYTDARATAAAEAYLTDEENIFILDGNA